MLPVEQDAAPRPHRSLWYSHAKDSGVSRALATLSQPGHDSLALNSSTALARNDVFGFTRREVSHALFSLHAHARTLSLSRALFNAIRIDRRNEFAAATDLSLRFRRHGSRRKARFGLAPQFASTQSPPLRLSSSFSCSCSLYFSFGRVVHLNGSKGRVLRDSIRSLLLEG